MLDLDRLDRLTALGERAQAPGLASYTAALRTRLDEGRFLVACMGQYKRGKSTLLNALLGDAILPAGVTPVTSVVTIVRHGPRLRARVQLPAGWLEVEPGEISAYVSEAANPENVKQVSAVEIAATSPLLATGMCLVDTPGLGSVFAGSSEATRQFIPQVDAALIVLGADPPISAAELELVRAAQKHTRVLLFVLNKADRLSGADLAEARAFTESTLMRALGRPAGPIFEISATERLSGRRTRDWDGLEGALTALAKSSGVELVRAAAERGIAQVGRRLCMHLAEHDRALKTPVAELEQRLETLRAVAGDARRALRDLGYLLQSEQDQLSSDFERVRETFLEKESPAALQTLGQAIDRSPVQRGPAGPRNWMYRARDIARDVVGGWLPAIQETTEATYLTATARFATLVSELLRRLGQLDDPALSVLPEPVGAELGFRKPSHFYFHELSRSSSPPLGQWIVDLFCAEDSVRRSTRRYAGAYLEKLLFANSHRVARDVAERVAKSRDLFEGEVGRRLDEITTSAEKALENAKGKHAAGDEAVREEIARIEQLRREVCSIVDVVPDA